MKLNLPRLFNKPAAAAAAVFPARRWPWQRRAGTGRLAVASTADHFLYAQADAAGRVLRCGRLARGSDTPAAFAKQIHALGLAGQQVHAVLLLQQAQLLQIEAPAVKADEMKAAARWRIKDQVEGRLDDCTIDVMFVGDDQPRPHRQLFVAAARNSVIADLSQRCLAAGLNLSVIDLAETAQRNLHAAHAKREGLAERATAVLAQHGAQCLLTVCMGDELYLARRLDWEAPALPGATATPGALAAAALAHAAHAAKPAVALEAMDFIDYGAEPENTTGDSDTAPRLAVELQRSFDVWERSWPDLPLARLWVHASGASVEQAGEQAGAQAGDPSGQQSAALAALLARHLGRPVGLLDAHPSFPGLAQAAPDPALRDALWPVLGLLLRSATRRL